MFRGKGYKIDTMGWKESGAVTEARPRPFAANREQQKRSEIPRDDWRKNARCPGPMSFDRKMTGNHLPTNDRRIDREVAKTWPGGAPGGGGNPPFAARHCSQSQASIIEPQRPLARHACGRSSRAPSFAFTPLSSLVLAPSAPPPAASCRAPPPPPPPPLPSPSGVWAVAGTARMSAMVSAGNRRSSGGREWNSLSSCGSSWSPAALPCCRRMPEKNKKV